MTPTEAAAFIALSDERDQWMARCISDSTKAYRDGFNHGRLYERTAADRLWSASPAKPLVGDGPTLAELEHLRWGPGGRESHLIMPPAVSDEQRQAAA
jgi:hypothetical protein